MARAALTVKRTVKRILDSKLRVTKPLECLVKTGAKEVFKKITGEAVATFSR